MNTWTCTRQGELYHHGIKGQKWGVRRFQNKDGSLTPAGKKRYDEYGMRYGIKAEYDKSKMDKDVILKKGTHIQNISSDGARDVSNDRPIYGAHTKHDKDAYGGRFAKAVDTRYGIAIKNDLVLLKDVKIASQKQAVETFMEMYDKDPKGVAESIGRAHAEMYVLQNNMPSVYREMVASRIANAYMVKGENWVKSKGYVVFNESMVSVKESEARNKYYDLLIKKGYGAIRDINDINDGYADDPVIFINAKSTMKNVKHRELTIAEMEIAKARYEYDKARRFDDPLQRAASTKSAKRDLKTAEKNSGVKKQDSYIKRRAKLDKMVKEYIRKHPNTKLTQSEIEEMLQEER
jgi:hypothetical protein